MEIERYSRQIAPSKPESLSDHLNREHLKLEKTLDGVRNGLKFVPKFSGWGSPNDPPSDTMNYWGPKTTGAFVVENPVSGRFFELEVADTAGGGPSVAGTIWAGKVDWSEFWGIGSVSTVSGRFQIQGTRAFEFDSAPYAGTQRLMVENTQAAIANDASGSANQATVNAILAALRAHNIIAP
jgi:hypothetical protein